MCPNHLTELFEPAILAKQKSGRSRSAGRNPYTEALLKKLKLPFYDGIRGDNTFTEFRDHMESTLETHRIPAIYWYRTVRSVLISHSLMWIHTQKAPGRWSDLELMYHLSMEFDISTNLDAQREYDELTQKRSETMGAFITRARKLQKRAKPGQDVTTAEMEHDLATHLVQELDVAYQHLLESAAFTIKDLDTTIAFLRQSEVKMRYCVNPRLAMKKGPRRSGGTGSATPPPLSLAAAVTGKISKPRLHNDPVPTVSTRAMQTVDTKAETEPPFAKAIAKLETRLRDQFTTILQENYAAMEKLWQDQQRKLQFIPVILLAARQLSSLRVKGAISSWEFTTTVVSLVISVGSVHCQNHDALLEDSRELQDKKGLPVPKQLHRLIRLLPLLPCGLSIVPLIVFCR